MKNNFVKYIIFATVLFTIFSCEKESLDIDSKPKVIIHTTLEEPRIKFFRTSGYDAAIRDTVFSFIDSSQGVLRRLWTVQEDDDPKYKDSILVVNDPKATSLAGSELKPFIKLGETSTDRRLHVVYRTPKSSEGYKINLKIYFAEEVEYMLADPGFVRDPGNEDLNFDNHKTLKSTPQDNGEFLVELDFNVDVVNSPIKVENEAFDSSNGEAINSTTGGVTQSVLDNDTFGKRVIKLGENRGEITLALESSEPTGLTLNADGGIVVPEGTALGIYTVKYSLTESIYPSNRVEGEAIVEVQ